MATVNPIIGCNVFETISLQCKDSVGGIKKAWVGAFEDFEFSATTASTVVTITTGHTTLYQVVPARTSSSAVESQAVDNTNTLWKQTVSLVFVKNQATLRNFVASIAKSTTVVVVQDRNDSFWLYGSDNGCQVGSDQGTGTVESDKNIWTIKFEATESYPALYVSASAMSPFLV